MPVLSYPVYQNPAGRLNIKYMSLKNIKHRIHKELVHINHSYAHASEIAFKFQVYENALNTIKCALKTFHMMLRQKVLLHIETTYYYP